MAWTDATQVEPWVKGVNLALPGMATAFVVPMAAAETLLKSRLVSFIPIATITVWTTTANTPPVVQLWTARLSAALYYHQSQGYQFIQETPSNEAAALYADVMAEIQTVEDGKREILTAAGVAVGRIVKYLTPEFVSPESLTEQWPYTTVSDDALE